MNNLKGSKNVDLSNNKEEVISDPIGIGQFDEDLPDLEKSDKEDEIIRKVEKSEELKCQDCEIEECDCVEGESCQCDHDCLCTDIQLCKELNDVQDILIDVEKLCL